MHITGIHPYADKFPMLPQVGMRATGTCTNPMSLATVSPSLDHPGFFDVAVSIDNQMISTRRPVSIDFAPDVVRSISGDADYKWHIEACNEIERPTSTSCVYFIADEDGFIKIGFAKSVASRLAALQTASRQELTLLAAIPGSMSDEAALHRKFTSDHVRGEWFRPSIELRNYIQEALQ